MMQPTNEDQFMKFFKTSFLSICFFTIFSNFCQASEELKESGANTATPTPYEAPEDEEVLKRIEQIQDRKLQLEAVAKEFPHIARAIIAENTYELSRFENYCAGIPADEGLTLEETFNNEKKRLVEEVEFFTKALAAQ